MYATVGTTENQNDEQLGLMYSTKGTLIKQNTFDKISNLTSGSSKDLEGALGHNGEITGKYRGNRCVKIAIDKAALSDEARTILTSLARSSLPCGTN